MDTDGCADFDCFEGVECEDVPAPGVGAVCGPCPDGYHGDGAKCVGESQVSTKHYAEIDKRLKNQHSLVKLMIYEIKCFANTHVANTYGMCLCTVS